MPLTAFVYLLSTNITDVTPVFQQGRVQVGYNCAVSSACLFLTIEACLNNLPTNQRLLSRVLVVVFLTVWRMHCLTYLPKSFAHFLAMLSIQTRLRQWIVRTILCVFVWSLLLKCPMPSVVFLLQHFLCPHCTRMLKRVVQFSCSFLPSLEMGHWNKRFITPILTSCDIAISAARLLLIVFRTWIRKLLSN